MLQRGKAPQLVEVDEHPRPGTSVEKLATLPTLFREGGSVTAGNSSGINDGGAAVVLMRESDVRAQGLTWLATIEEVTTAAIDPDLMGYAPVAALESLFQRAAIGVDAIELVELNEAFAAQAMPSSVMPALIPRGPTPLARRSRSATPWVPPARYSPSAQQWSYSDTTFSTAWCPCVSGVARRSLPC